MERVAFAEQTERETDGGSFLWKAEVKTAPELPCRKQSKHCRISASKNRICWNPKVKNQGGTVHFFVSSMHP